jgi:hypothetical protein
MQAARAHWLVKSEPDGFCRAQPAANRIDNEADAPLRCPVTRATINATAAQWPLLCRAAGCKGEAWRH